MRININPLSRTPNPIEGRFDLVMRVFNPLNSPSPKSSPFKGEDY